MAYVALGTKAVGSTVKLNVGGAAKEFIVVHQGKPSGIYDDSCNGTWLLMKDIYETRQWHSSNVNKLESSAIHSYLNSTFLGLFDADIRDAIKQVKIPYRKNGGSGGTTQQGANGLSCKIFLPSAPEVHFTHSYIDAGEGAALSYFASCATTAADAKRIAKLNGSAAYWWLRSPLANDTGNVWAVYTNGNYDHYSASYSHGVRPALVLPSTLLVSDDGSVTTNKPPAITSSAPSGSNLGTKTAGFDFTYKVTDADGDTVTVREYLDNALQRTYTATLGAANTFQCVTAANFQTIRNGSHTLKIVANDGKADSAAYTVTFTKKVTTAAITLSSPLEADDEIRVMVLNIAGSLPSDANLEVLVTNNAKDESPVWEDATADVKAGVNHVFTNKTAANGFAFNFKITVSRGASGAGGYISNIGGATAAYKDASGSSGQADPGIAITGVCWDWGNQSTALSRLTPSNDPNQLVNTAIASEPVPAVGAGSGSSPCDSIEPWASMVEYNVESNAITTKKGDSGFSRTNKDTVVYIPEFYYKIVDVNSKRYFYIADKAKDDFTKHPGSGKYVGRYNTIAGYYSKSGAAPLTNITRATARTNSRAKGSKWSEHDIASWCAVWLLYLVEYADWNSQSKIGRGNVDSGAVQNVGGTDSMTYHTGRASGEDGKTQVQYRWIENPWGNVWEWIDGINFSERKAYICTTPANYADDTATNYTDTGVTLCTDGWIKTLGLSSGFPWAFLPTANGGSDSTYIPDYVGSSAGWRVLQVGGHCSNTSYAGLFCFNASYTSSGANAGIGARLLYHP